MAVEMSKVYEPKQVEAAVYERWLKEKVFHVEPSPNGPGQGNSYSIVIPPPNVTGGVASGPCAE